MVHVVCDGGEDDSEELLFGEEFFGLPGVDEHIGEVSDAGGVVEVVEGVFSVADGEVWWGEWW